MSAPDCAPTNSELLSWLPCFLPHPYRPAWGVQDSWLALAIRPSLPSLSGCCGTMLFTQRSLLPCFSLQQSHILLLLPDSEQEQPAPTTPSFLMQGRSCLQQDTAMCIPYYNLDRNSWNSLSVQAVPPPLWMLYTFDTISPCLLTHYWPGPTPLLVRDLPQPSHGVLNWLQSPE